MVRVAELSDFLIKIYKFQIHSHHRKLFQMLLAHTECNQRTFRNNLIFNTNLHFNKPNRA